MAKKSRKKKNPFRSYSEKQVKAAEESSFFMVVGDDVFRYGNQMTFSKEDMDFHYAQILNYLKEMIDEGDDESKQHALKNLMSLKVYPLRIN